jgi:hypothetical protein
MIAAEVAVVAVAVVAVVVVVVAVVVVVLAVAVAVAAMTITLTSKIFLVLNCRLKNVYFILCIKMPLYLVCYVTSVNI